MIITLYKNSQTESDDNNLYTDLWQLSPYSPSSMFCTGFTTETANFILPNEFNILSGKNGEKTIIKNKTLFVLVNSQEGKPALKVSGSNIISLILQKEGELFTPVETQKISPETEKQHKLLKDDDYYNEDGSLNIW